MNMNQKAADRMIVSVGGSESPDRHSNKTDRQQLAIEERHNLCNKHITSSSEGIHSTHGSIQYTEIYH